MEHIFQRLNRSAFVAHIDVSPAAHGIPRRLLVHDVAAAPGAGVAPLALALGKGFNQFLGIHSKSSLFNSSP